MNPGAALVDLLKFGAAADAFVRLEPARRNGYSLLTVRRLRPFARRRFSTSRPFFVLIRTRKPCVLRAVALVRLKRALALHDSLRITFSSDDRTANVSERVPKVSMRSRFVLESASFASAVTADSAPSPCAFGLFPKFSTPVEKTVENSPMLTNVAKVQRIRKCCSRLYAMNLWEQISARSKPR